MPPSRLSHRESSAAGAWWQQKAWPVAAVWHPHRARFVVQLRATERRYEMETMFNRPAKTSPLCRGTSREGARSRDGARWRDGVGASFLCYDRQGEIAT
jgi:hypothetical protein